MDPKQRILLAVSGGLDSVALMVCLKKWGAQNLDGIHFDHGWRQESQKEAQWVQDLAQELGCGFHGVSLSMTGKQSEAHARRLRYDCLKSMERDYDHIITAHHIDDSIEWHFMSEFKSSNLKTSLGIPLRRGKLVRPFHAFTKEQIARLARELSLVYWEDASNQDTRFERNYMRQELGTLKKRFPSYPKHFVTRSNEWAKLLGCSVYDDRPAWVTIGAHGIHLMSASKSFQGSYRQIERSVRALSSDQRGSLRSQIKKLMGMSHQGGIAGPLVFSGGVYGFAMP